MARAGEPRRGAPLVAVATLLALSLAGGLAGSVALAQDELDEEALLDAVFDDPNMDWGEAPALPYNEPVIADRVVSVVGDMVITQHDTLLEEAIQSRLQRETQPFNTPSPIERAEEIRIVTSLARGIPTFEPRSAEVEQRLAEMRLTWGRDWDPFLAHFGLTEEQLAGVVFRELMVERYVSRSLNNPLAAEWELWISQQRERVEIRRVAPRANQ